MKTKFCAGAIIEFPGSRLFVTEAGDLRHSAGFGPVDYRVCDLNGRFKVGTLINTPFGHCEVVDVPRQRFFTPFPHPDDEQFLSFPIAP